MASDRCDAWSGSSAARDDWRCGPLESHVCRKSGLEIHGGVAHGIGNAFFEQLTYDEQGQLLNASFMDYLLPTATDVPPIETAHNETASPFNPVGLKGVGEAGCIPTGAVFAQAIDDALAGTGIEIREIPLSPNRLFELLSQVKPT